MEEGEPALPFGGDKGRLQCYGPDLRDPGGSLLRDTPTEALVPLQAERAV